MSPLFSLAGSCFIVLQFNDSGGQDLVLEDLIEKVKGEKIIPPAFSLSFLSILIVPTS
jgi:hypothetical protein